MFVYKKLCINLGDTLIWRSKQQNNKTLNVRKLNFNITFSQNFPNRCGNLTSFNIYKKVSNLQSHMATWKQQSNKFESQSNAATIRKVISHTLNNIRIIIQTSPLCPFAPGQRQREVEQIQTKRQLHFCKRMHAHMLAKAMNPGHYHCTKVHSTSKQT